MLSEELCNRVVYEVYSSKGWKAAVNNCCACKQEDVTWYPCFSYALPIGADHKLTVYSGIIPSR